MIILRSKVLFIILFYQERCEILGNIILHRGKRLGIENGKNGLV